MRFILVFLNIFFANSLANLFPFSYDPFFAFVRGHTIVHVLVPCVNSLFKGLLLLLVHSFMPF